MASTRTIQNTINWLLGLTEQQPPQVNGMEPALTSANLILQTMLGPPFAWPWNRSTINFTASAQDTTITGLNAFGFLEGGSVTPQAGGNPMPLSVRLVMEGDASSARPQYVAALLDDGGGDITFRLTPAPDQPYVVNLLAQKKAPDIRSVGYTWSPVPDDKAYIAEWGFLSLISLIGNDSRFNEYNQKFVVSILSAQGGLSELEKNLFLTNWTKVIAQLQSTQLGTTQRYKAREA